jgi:hypothetical protein
MQYFYLRLGVYSCLSSVFLNGIVNESQSVFSVLALVLYGTYLSIDTFRTYLESLHSSAFAGNKQLSLYNAIAHNGIDIVLFLCAVVLSNYLGSI